MALNTLLRRPTKVRAKRKNRFSRLESLEKREMLTASLEFYYEGSPVNGALNLDASVLSYDSNGWHFEVELRNTSTNNETLYELGYQLTALQLNVNGNFYSGPFGDLGLDLPAGQSIDVKGYVNPISGLWIGDLGIEGSIDIGGYASDYFVIEIEWPGAEIDIYDSETGGTEIPSQTGQVDFSSTPVGEPVQRTFRVENSDLYTDLVLGAITIPSGFSLLQGFGTTVVAPGASTTFTVQLDAAVAGSYSGQISIVNNDGDQYSWPPDYSEAPYVFTIFGDVVEPEYGVLDVRDATAREKDEGYSTSLTPEQCGCSCTCTIGMVDEQSLSIGGDVPQGLVNLEAQITGSPSSSDTVTVTWELDGQSPVSVQYTINSSGTVSDWSAVAHQFDVSGLAPGEYSYTATFDSNAFSPNLQNYVHEGAIFVRGHDAVSGGARIEGLGKITEGSDDSVWVDFGMGDAHQYSSNGDGTYTSPNGKLDSLVKNVDNTFTLRRRDDVAFHFSATGRMLSRIEPNGQMTGYSYVDGTGDGIAAQISTITSPGGQVATYNYIGGKLANFTAIDGAVTTFGYNTNGFMNSIIRPAPGGMLSAPETTFTYNSAGRPLTVTEPGGLTTEFVRNDHGFVEETIAADGSSVQFSKPFWQTLPVSGTGSPGNPADFIDPGEILGSYTDQQQRVTYYTTDSLGKITREIDALGNETIYERDENGLITRIILPDPDGPGPLESPVYEYTYDDRGNLLMEVMPDLTFRTWVYHSTWNQPVEFVDANGAITLFTYDVNAAILLSETQVIGEIDDVINEETDDLTTTYTYTPAPTLTADPPQGLLASITAPDGVVTQYEYDQHGNRTKIIYAVGTSDEAEVTMTYDLAGNILTRTDELGRTTTYEYDVLSRLIEITEPDPDGAGPLSARVTTLTYNEMGFLASEAVNGRTTEYTYNSLGQLITITEPDPDGTGPQSAPVTSYTYHSDGNLATVTDPLGNVTTYAYTDGLLTSISEPDPDGSGPQSAPVTTFTYDDAGRMLTMTDALGHTTTYTYDNLGRLVSTTLPDPDGAGPLLALSDHSEFDLLGRVVAYTDFHGVTTSYTYDGEGYILTETTPLGTTTFEYDELGRLITETSEDPDAAGPLTALVTIYAYTAVGQLASVTTPLGITLYEYDNRRRQTKITLPDPDGTGPEEAPVTSFTYDAVGNLLTETDPLGNVTTYVYDDLDRVIEIVAPDPDDAGPLLPPVTSYEYDDFGQLVAIIDPNGGVTSFEYDDLGRLVKETLPDPDGAGPQSAPEITYVYDANDQLIAEIDVLGNATTYEYDNLGQLITITLPDPDGAGPLAAPVITFAYDAIGQLLSETDPLGRVTSYTYDAMGRILTETLPDPDGGGPLDAPVTSYTYGVDGRLESIEDAEGQLVSYTYTAAGQIATITDPRGVTTYTYDALGRTISIVEPDPDGAGPASGPFTHYDYDDRGMMSAITTPDGTTTYLYNNLGYLAQVTTPGSSDGLQKASRTTYIYDASGNLISEFDGKRAENQNANQFDVNNDGVANEDDLDALVYAAENGFPEGYFYDINGDGFFTVHDLNLMITYLYNVYEVYDFPTLYWHPGNHTQYEYDNLNRLIKKIDAEGGETTYSYDANGNRLSLTDPVGNTTSWEYDLLNRLTTETNHLEDTRHFAYDLAGNILEYTDRNGRVTEYAYDNLQRRIGETWLNGVTPIHTLEYAYDAASQLIFAGDSHAEYTFTYDNLGRVISTEHDLDALGFSVTLDQAYDALNRRISLAANIDGIDDLINQYQYDYLNRMTQVTQSGQTGGNAVAEKRVDFAYDPLNDYRYESITRYADLSGTKMVAATNYSYDSESRLVALTHADGSSNTLAGYTWTYDSAGRLTHFTVAGYSDEDAVYTYGNTNQLIGVERDGTANDEEYTYDENGNRIGGGYTVGDNNQLLSDGTFNYTYDAEGNRLTKTEIATGYVTEYEWDYRNRLTAIIQKDDLGNVIHEVQYTYDIFNHRIVKTIDADGAGPGETTQEIYIHDGLRQQRGNAGDHILLAFNEEGDLTHRYLHGPDVDQILAAEEVTDPEFEGDVLWALTDHLGSVRDLAEYDDGTDTTTVVNHITYDAFGNITAETNAAVDFLFGFTGRERDAESDLQFNRARYYDAAIGRWISEDPIGFDAGDENLVRYVGNEPIFRIDPSGLWSPPVIFSGASWKWKEDAENQVEEVKIVWKNTEHMPPLQRAYVNLGFFSANQVGVRGVSDMCSRHDAADGHLQSNWERGLDGLSGSATLISTGFGGKAILLPRPSRLIPRVNVTPSLIDDAAAAGSIEFRAGRQKYFDFISKRPDIDPAGTLDIVLHGHTDKVLVADGLNVNHRVLARLIQQNPQFNNQSIRLLSCNTGRSPTGFAQNLANKLNVPVSAPNKLLWAHPDGTHFVSEGKMVGKYLVPAKPFGEFIQFYPFTK